MCEETNSTARVNMKRISNAEWKQKVSSIGTEFLAINGLNWTKERFRVNYEEALGASVVL